MTGLLAACLRMPHVDHATVALLMVLASVSLATFWGAAEAFISSVVGALGYVYYFLPPRGFGIAKPDHVVALLAFMAVALGISQLAARSKQLLRERDSLLQLSLDPLCMRDFEGNFRRVNEAMVELIGVPAKELCSRPFRDFVHPDDHERTAAAYRKLRENHSPVELENRYRTKDGGWRWLHWKIAPPPPDGSWVSAVAHDVTEERWANEKLHDLANQVMTAQEDERRRIARDLHDDVTQRLATIGIELGLMKRTASATAQSLEDLNRLQAQILQLSEDIRRLSHSLHPSILVHSDLATSLEMHCREFSGQHGITANFTARDVPAHIPHAATLALYRIVQESLRNVARHSGATAANVVLAGENGGGLSLFVIDNGKGFDVSRAKVRPGLGLVSIDERARHIGASVVIESMPDAGTRLSVQIPAQRADDRGR